MDNLKKILPIFIIDFDSTIVTVEGLDELARISLEHNPKKDQIAQQISDITNQQWKVLLIFLHLSQNVLLFSTRN